MVLIPLGMVLSFGGMRFLQSIDAFYALCWQLFIFITNYRLLAYFYSPQRGHAYGQALLRVAPAAGFTIGSVAFILVAGGPPDPASAALAPSEVEGRIIPWPVAAVVGGYLAITAVGLLARILSTSRIMRVLTVAMMYRPEAAVRLDQGRSPSCAIPDTAAWRASRWLSPCSTGGRWPCCSPACSCSAGSRSGMGWRRASWCGASAKATKPTGRPPRRSSRAAWRGNCRFSRPSFGGRGDDGLPEAGNSPCQTLEIRNRPSPVASDWRLQRLPLPDRERESERRNFVSSRSASRVRVESQPCQIL